MKMAESMKSNLKFLFVLWIYNFVWYNPFSSQFYVKAERSYEETKISAITQRLSIEISEIAPASPEDGNRQTNEIHEILTFLGEAPKICQDDISFLSRCQAIKWLAFDDELLDSSSIEFVQRYILAVFYFATDGDDWIYCSIRDDSPCEDDSSRFSRFLTPTVSVCQWYGIKCSTNSDGTRTHITWMEFPENNLKQVVKDTSLAPIIVPEIRLLSDHLELLWLQSNPSLGGTLPSWIGHMSALQSLSLFNVGLEGTIPTTLYHLEQLDALRLYDNSLSGTIAPEIRNMQSLSWLWLNNNNLTGDIPTELGSLKKLESLTLHNNRFENLEPPNVVCDLRQKKLKHLWIDCKSSEPLSDVSCKCCTRCFIIT